MRCTLTEQKALRDLIEAKTSAAVTSLRGIHPAAEKTDDCHHTNEHDHSIAGIELRRLRKMLADSVGIIPPEQSQRVALGTGVLLEHEGGEKEAFLVIGLVFEGGPAHGMTLMSPLMLEMQKQRKDTVGSKISYQVAGRTTWAKILAIAPPSKADQFCEEHNNKTCAPAPEKSRRKNKETGGVLSLGNLVAATA